MLGVPNTQKIDGGMQNAPMMNGGIAQGYTHTMFRCPISFVPITASLIFEKPLHLSVYICTVSDSDLDLGTYRHKKHRKHHHSLQDVPRVEKRPREHFDVAALNIPNHDSSKKDSTRIVGSNIGVHSNGIETRKKGAITVDLSTPVLGMECLLQILYFFNLSSYGEAYITFWKHNRIF